MKLKYNGKLKYDRNELVFMQYIAGMNAIGERVQLVTLTKMIRSYDVREFEMERTNYPGTKRQYPSLSDNVAYAKLLLEKFENKFQANYKMYLAVYNHMRDEV